MLKIEKMPFKDRLWFRIFRNVTLIFLAFLIVLSVANELLLVPFYTYKQKQLLLSQMDTVSRLGERIIPLPGGRLPGETVETLSRISDRNHFEVEIYRADGEIIYTSSGSQMMDHIGFGPQFSMQHDSFKIKDHRRKKDGTVFETVQRNYGNREEYLLCRREIVSGLFAEIRVPKQMIVSAAKSANELIFYIAAGCFALSIIWVFVFARRFSKPIAEMNRITKDLSSLDFSRKVTVRGSDEIAQLGNSVNEMSDSLSTALSRLQETNAKLWDEIELQRRLDEMRRDFVANVSHELKTPISIISGYAEGLKLNVNEAAREEYCNTILDESRRMNGLVLKILELSRYESGKTELHPERFNIGLLATQMAERIFRESEIRVTVDIPPETFVFADPLLIGQVLQAYLENARSHTPADGTVTVGIVQNGGENRLTVENTGSWVDPEKMPEIWQSFYRGDSAHRRQADHFGLGLSIVSAIAKLYGTACGVCNTENGVCFWFGLPAEESKGEEE